MCIRDSEKSNRYSDRGTNSYGKGSRKSDRGGYDAKPSRKKQGKGGYESSNKRQDSQYKKDDWMQFFGR